jgi:hypothetical protein
MGPEYLFDDPRRLEPGCAQAFAKGLFRQTRGYYLAVDAFQVFATNPTAKRPDWYVPIKSLFYVISVAEVALFYLGTCFFAVSLKRTGLLTATAFRWYFCCSLVAALLLLTPSNWPEPFGTASYLVAVPAIPYVMYYLIGLQLLKTSGEVKNHDGRI